MAEATSGGEPVLSVGQVAAGLRELLEDRVGRLWIVGEISNCRRYASGHTYFTLKDDDAQLEAVLFRNAAQRLGFEPEDGLEVLAYGELDFYAARGKLQLVVRALEARGEGMLRLAFERLRSRLEAEGLFAPELKRAIPRLPRALGVVASLGSASLHDVLEVSGRRWPALPLRIAPTRVQGAGAEHEIARALEALDAHGDIDCILLVRGGGSLEDLQAFNTEVVARAIRACSVPVVCGVGHEVDVTIADLAADLRAPTPSAAAEQALPERAGLLQILARDWRRLQRAARQACAQQSASLARRHAALEVRAPAARLAAQRARVEGLQRGLRAAIHALCESESARWSRSAGQLPRLARRLGAECGRRFAGLPPALLRETLRSVESSRVRLERLAAGLEALSPLAVLGRGYAIARREADGAIVRRSRDVVSGEALRLRLGEGELHVRVEAPPGAVVGDGAPRGGRDVSGPGR